jgi:hypothetical protein
MNIGSIFIGKKKEKRNKKKARIQKVGDICSEKLLYV